MQNKKGFNKLSLDQLKQLNHGYIATTEQQATLEELQEEEKKDKLNEIYKKSPPRSFWFELPYTTLLTVVLSEYGLLETMLEIANSDDPNQSALDLFESIQNESDYNTEEEPDEDIIAIILSLHSAVISNLNCRKMFGLDLNDLVAKAKDSDENLFDAILVDPSVISTYVASKRIHLASLENDRDFFNQLSKALTKTRPRRPEEIYDDTRVIFSVLEDMKSFRGMKLDDLYDLVNRDLKVYPGVSGNTLDKFKKFAQRYKRKSRT